LLALGEHLDSGPARGANGSSDGCTLSASASSDRTNDCAYYGSASDHLSRALVRANSTVKVSLTMAPPCVLDEELETYNAAVEAANRAFHIT
jgi:hypothetical protein